MIPSLPPFSFKIPISSSAWMLRCSLEEAKNFSHFHPPLLPFTCWDMGKQPVGGGESRSRARASGAAPSMREPTPQTHTPPQERRQEEIVHGVRHAVAPRDGTGATVAGGRPDRRTRFVTQETEARQSPVHADAGAAALARRPGRPSYLPARLRRAEEGQPRARTPSPAAGHPPLAPAPHAAMPEEQQAPRVGPPGVKPAKTLDTHKSSERTSTLRDDDGAYPDEQALPGRTFPAAWPPQDETEEQRAAPVVPAGARRHDNGDDGGAGTASLPHLRPPPPGPSYVAPLRHTRERRRRPVTSCCTACWILSCLLVIATCLAVVAVFLAYHPKSTRLSVTSATLNAAHIDKLDGDGDPRRGLNANLTVLAAISNPNAKITIVLRYVQLDLSFEDSVIATQAVWQAPVQVAHGGSVLRRVHLVVSNVTVTQQDADVWQNATAKDGGPVALQLAGKFHTELYFGRWLRYRYWAKPQCTLWLDPPPSGVLRRSQC